MVSILSMLESLIEGTFLLLPIIESDVRLVGEEKGRVALLK